MNDMENPNILLNKLYNIFTLSWIAHWDKSGEDNIAIHETLDELYNELKDFTDEFVETIMSDGNSLKEILPLNVSFKEVPEGILSSLVLKMISLRKDLLAYDIPVMQDWKGRFIARLSHYIFMLKKNSPKFSFFEKRDSALVGELRKLFKNQNEFVTRFHNFLKGRSGESQRVFKFFKDNEEELTDLMNEILESNTELFSIRDSVIKEGGDSIDKYNDLVRYFDLFLD